MLFSISLVVWDIKVLINYINILLHLIVITVIVNILLYAYWRKKVQRFISTHPCVCDCKQNTHLHNTHLNILHFYTHNICSHPCTYTHTYIYVRMYIHQHTPTHTSHGANTRHCLTTRVWTSVDISGHVGIFGQRVFFFVHVELLSSSAHLSYLSRDCGRIRVVSWSANGKHPIWRS